MSADNESCFQHWPTAMDVYLSALLIQTPSYTPHTDTQGENFNGLMYLFNNNHFDKAGLITSWIFAAKLMTRKTSPFSNSRDRFPQLHIWTPVSEEIYQLQYTTKINTTPSILLGTLNMYMLELDPPPSYKQNDIVALYQPRDGLAVLQIAFVNSHNTSLQALVKPTSLTSETIAIFDVTQDHLTTTVLPLMTLSTKLASLVQLTSVRQKSANCYR